MKLEMSYGEHGEPLVYGVLGGAAFVVVEVTRKKWMDVLEGFRADNSTRDWLPIGHASSLDVSGGLAVSRFAVRPSDVPYWQEYFAKLPEPTFDPPRL